MNKKLKQFTFHITQDGDPTGEEGIIGIAQSVLDMGRSKHFADDETTASYIALHLVVKERNTSQLEGFNLLANDPRVKIIKYPKRWNNYGCEAFSKSPS